MELIIINDFQLELANKVQYLGVMLDNKLNFGVNVRYISKKTLKNTFSQHE